MKKNKIHASSQVRTNFGSDHAPVNFQAFLPKEPMGNSIPELNPPLAVLHAAHKGMHPVIFTVLAALHDMLNNQDTVTHLSQGKLR